MERTTEIKYNLRRQSQSGQIGIIIILIMIVMLTIGLSLVAQSSTNLSLSTQEEQSTQVFNAAEAGVEQALSTDFSTLADTYTAPQFTFQNSNANANVNYTITKKHILDTRLFQGDTATVQLWDTANKQTVSNLIIDWASGARDCSTTPQPASLIISTYSIDPITKVVSVRHDAFAVCDHKDNIGTVGTGSGYQGEKVLTVTANDAFMRIKPVYNDTVLHVTGSGYVSDLTNQLPVQYYSILSTAQNSSGNETRAVQVNRTLSVAPYIMDYALFSGTTLVK